MSNNGDPNFPPFPSSYRGSGLLLHEPGRAEGNWSWRCPEELLAGADFHRLRDLNRSTSRLRMLPSPAREMAETML